MQNVNAVSDYLSDLNRFKSKKSKQELSKQANNKRIFLKKKNPVINKTKKEENVQRIKENSSNAKKQKIQEKNRDNFQESK